mmetsp:Transcript_110208/g.310843  ORF Transcript_110208/g.310843 Transcript_110208/m.310843 type:complete len:211 (-) Transcript_110208:258-890(-)
MVLIALRALAALQEVVGHPQREHVHRKRRDHHDNNELCPRERIQPTKQDSSKGAHSVGEIDRQRSEEQFLDDHKPLPIKQLSAENGNARRATVLPCERQLGSADAPGTVDALQQAQQPELDGHPKRVVQRKVDPIPVARVCVRVKPRTKGHGEENVHEVDNPSRNGLLRCVEEPNLPWPSNLVSEALAHERHKANGAQNGLQPPPEGRSH